MNNRDRTTIGLMMEIYCQGKHGTADSLCPECRNLLEYVNRKLDRCPFENKPACRECEVHCYENGKREAIREVMRYSGGRMFVRHPVMTLLHYLGKDAVTPSLRPRRKRAGLA